MLSERLGLRAARAHMIGVATLILTLGLVPWRSVDEASGGTWPFVPFAIGDICFASCAVVIGWIRRRSWGGSSIQSSLAMVNFFNPVAFWRARKVLGWSPKVTAAFLTTVVLLSALAQAVLHSR